jgi:hypothetical protein
MTLRERNATAKIGWISRSGVTLARPPWARTVSNRRPLVCKTEPDGLRRFMRWRPVPKCPAQRPARVHAVSGISGRVCPSWHTLGTTGVLPSATTPGGRVPGKPQVMSARQAIPRRTSRLGSAMRLFPTVTAYPGASPKSSTMTPTRSSLLVGYTRTRWPTAKSDVRDIG